MIFDGRWKWELKKLRFIISIWRILPPCSDFAEHQINRAILYSATILRKVIEDETELESIAKKAGIRLSNTETIYATVKATKFLHVGEQWVTRGKIFASDYGLGNKVMIKAKDICNWLIHSYLWSIVYSSKRGMAKGFLVASDFDKEKFIHFVSFEEWLNLLNSVIAKGIF